MCCHNDNLGTTFLASRVYCTVQNSSGNTPRSRCCCGEAQSVITLRSQTEGICVAQPYKTSAANTPRSRRAAAKHNQLYTLRSQTEWICVWKDFGETRVCRDRRFGSKRASNKMREESLVKVCSVILDFKWGLKVCCRGQFLARMKGGKVTNKSKRNCRTWQRHLWLAAKCHPARSR
jgi:hypothetical protein